MRFIICKCMQLVFIVFLIVISSGHARSELLGLEGKLEMPDIFYEGNINYVYDNSSGTGNLSVSALPLSLTLSNGDFFFRNLIFPEDHSDSLVLNVKVDGSGNLVGGVESEPDLIIKGDAGIWGLDGFEIEYSGVLLTGDVLAFGYEDNTPGTDFFDFIFEWTGGLLAPEWVGIKIGVVVQSEVLPGESQFTGGFTSDFTQGAKGDVGVPIPEPASMALLTMGLAGLIGIRRKIKKR